MNIEKLLKTSIKCLKKNIINSEYYVYNKKLIDFKKLSIRKLINEEETLDYWIYDVNNIAAEEDLELPIEAYLLVVRELNKYDLNSELLLEADKFATLLIDRLLEETHFSIDKDLLYKFVKQIKINNSIESKKSFLLKKIKRLVKIDIDTNNDIIIGFKIYNINKLEISGYIAGLENYYVLPNENIKVIDIKSNKEILDLLQNKRSIVIENDYDILMNYLFLNNLDKLTFNKKYERMLMYSATKYIVEIYNSKTTSVKLSDEKLKIILDLKDLLSLDYQDKLLKKANMQSIKKYIDKLEANPTNEELKIILKDCNNIDWIFEILRMAPKVVKEEIPVNIYLEAIMKCSKIDKYNIKIALLCEELIVKKPVIIEEIVGFLVELYKSNVFTKNTINTLEYLRCTIRDNKIIDEALINIRAENEQYDKEFLDKLLKMYRNNIDKKKLDPIINKLINGKHINIKPNVYSVIYDFYIRNNDIRALESLCNAILKNNDKLIDNQITAEDVIKLLNYFINIKSYNINNILKIINEYKNNNEVINIGVDVLENSDMIDRYKIPVEFEDLYFNIIYKIRRRNDVVWKVYIRILTNKAAGYKYRDKEIIDLIDELNVLLMSKELNKSEINDSIKIINIIINNFIKINNNLEAVKYIQIYLEKFSKHDEGKLFKDILITNYENVNFIEEMLKYLDFTNIYGVDQLLKMVFNALVSKERYKLLIEILRYYKDTERYDDSLAVLQKYIESVNEIDEFDYEMFISPIIENMDKDILGEVYKLLVLREDLPISFREKIYIENNNIDLDIMNHNINKIINAFKNDETVSAVAKNLSLERYINNNDELQILVCKGENDKKTCEIIYSKVKELFRDSKHLVEFIITDELAKLDERLNNIKKYANNYNDNLFSLQNSEVLGEYLVIKKEEGDLAASLKLDYLFTEDKNIVNSDDKCKSINAVLFKSIQLYDILIKYLNNNNINFEIIDKETIKILCEKETTLNDNISLNDILNNFNKLIKLQMLLIKNKMIMIEFIKSSFILTSNCFVPNNFTNICEFEDELICKDSEIFKDIKDIRNKNKRVVINEKNITKIMIKYIENVLLEDIKLNADHHIDNNENNSFEEEEKIKGRFIQEISNSDNINTLEDLYKIIDTFLEKENKLFEDLSYRKQLKIFYDIPLENQIKVICKAIENKDTTLDTKNKVIYFEHIPEKNIEDYFKYIIECYNNTLDLEVEDYGYIYDKVTQLINSNLISDSVINSEINEIAMLYITSREKCKYKKRDIEEDIDSIIYDIDKEYIKSRIE